MAIQLTTTLRKNAIFIQDPKIMRKMAKGTMMRFANHLTLIPCFIFYEKWVREMCPIKAHLP